MNSIMRQTLITFLALAAATAVAPAVAVAQEPRVRVNPRVPIEQERQRLPRGTVDDAREQHRETFTKVLKLGGAGELDVSNVTGDITIARSGGNDATIEVSKVARARTVAEAREFLPLVRVDITERSNRAEVRTVYPAHENGKRNRRNVNVAVHIAITAPAGTRITARSVTGNVTATEITGELALMSVSGNVQVTKGRRVSSVKSTSGFVGVADTDSDVAIEASTISGNVTMRQVKAPRLELATISGKVVMHEVHCTRIEAESLSGDVEFTGSLAKGGRYEMNSHSGNVRLAVSSGIGFEFEANSWSGNVDTDLPIAVRATDKPLPPRGPRRKMLSGVIGDGSAVIDITTFSGNVWIGKR